MNRCLAEGRERFRHLLTRSEDGTRCNELLPLLSAFCDGEASAEDETVVREHLRACAACRGAMRSYRATPAAVAAVAPALPVVRSLSARAHEFFAGLHSRLPWTGGASDSGLAQVAATGGTRGAGMAALAKALAICAGTVGGAAACVATGIAPAPLGIEPQHSDKAKIERVSGRAIEEAPPYAVEYEPAPPSEPQPQQQPEPEPQPQPEPEPEPTTPETTEAGAVEYAPPPEPASPPPTAGSPGSSSGSAAGEFGP